MKKLIMILAALAMAIVPVLTCAEGTADDGHNYYVFKSGENNYDLFVITKMNYGEDHKVTSVTGHFERVYQGEEYEESETAPNSEKTYQLAPDFKAEMVDNMFDEFKLEPVTDLYQWYIKAYMGEGYDGHELVYSCDLTTEQQEQGIADFWFVTTKIELNDKDEIQYMQYIYVPWA